MPLYEYRCTNCDHRFELWQKMGAGKEGVTCPQCGSHEVQRLLSTFASNSRETSSPQCTGGGCCGPACGVW